MQHFKNTSAVQISIIQQQYCIEMLEICSNNTHNITVKIQISLKKQILSVTPGQLFELF